VWEECYGLDENRTGYPPTFIQLCRGTFPKAVGIHLSREAKERSAEVSAYGDDYPSLPTFRPPRRTPQATCDKRVSQELIDSIPRLWSIIWST